MGGAISTIVSSFCAWFFTKKKYNSEVDANLISNMQESLEFYKALADDNKARLDDVLAENADLRKQLGELREMVDKLNSVLAVHGLKKLMEEG